MGIFCSHGSLMFIDIKPLQKTQKMPPLSQKTGDMCQRCVPDRYIETYPAEKMQVGT